MFLTSKRSDQNCSQGIILKVYSFKGQIFNCDKTASDLKDKVIIEIIDIETGENVVN